MSNKLTKHKHPEVLLTERQRNIKALREQLNAAEVEAEAEAIKPFTAYKLWTYLCVIFLPLVPLAIYRIWNIKTEFTAVEQRIWTAVIAVIGVYMIKISYFL